MAAPRNTVSIAALVERVNTHLAAERGTPAARAALMVLLDGVLMDADQYRGFNYLPDQFKTVELPGGTRRELRDDYDSTRVFYYPPRG